MGEKNIATKAVLAGILRSPLPHSATKSPIYEFPSLRLITRQINFFDLSGDDDYKEIRNPFF